MATTTTTIPANISLEAASHVVQRGLWREFEEMLEHTKQAVPNLESIFSRLDTPVDDGDRAVLIIAETAASPDDNVMAGASTEMDWDRWAIATFPPDVSRHFCLMILRGAGNAG